MDINGDKNPECPQPDNSKTQLLEFTKPKYFDDDAALVEETGEWIPISIPPISEIEHEEWMHGLPSNGGYYQEKDCWLGDDKDLTMWDVVAELLLAGREKVGSSASSGLQRFNFSFVSGHLLEQAWKDVAATVTEANLVVINKIIEMDPPKWLPDSAASACMLCGLSFHQIMCSRHHCQFCGGVFCGDCTKGRSLLPARFHLLGTGIVVARREDGSWSRPSAMSLFGVSWGAQAGGELTDFIIVLRTADALNTFSGSGHISVGAGMSGAIGTAGRTIGADVRAGIGGYSACYTYSCSKGQGKILDFMGVSLSVLRIF